MQYINIELLQISPFNVRKTSDKVSDEQLKASIIAHGLLQNLSVQELKEDGESQFYVIAGARRLKALKELVKEGTYSKNYAVPCEVFNDKTDCVELSLAENTVRLAMHPVDEFEAFAKMLEAGAVASQIAINFGVPARHVEARLRMSKLDPMVLKALRDNKISLEQAMAFAVTNDKKRQVRVLKDVRDHTHAHNIKRELTEGLEAHDSEMGKYVGKDAYVEVGGAIREDLLGEMFWFENIEVLRELATKKMKPTIDKLLADGWGWVEFIPSRAWEFTQSLGRNWDKNPSKKLKALMGCVLEFGHDGKLNIITGYIKKADAAKYKEASPKQKGASSTDNLPKGREKGAMTQSLKDSLTKQRQVIMQYAIASNPSLAADFLLFSMIESLLKKEHTYSPGVRGLNITFHDETKKDFAKDSAGVALSLLGEKCIALMNALKSEKDGNRFLAYSKFTEQQKMQLMGFCTGICVEGMLADAMNSSVMETALSFSGINVRQYWTPTKDNYLNSITREQLVKIVGDILGKAAAKKYEATKKPDLVKNLHDAFADPEKASGGDKAVLQKLQQWTPEHFAFAEAPTAAAKPKGKKAA